MMRLQFSSVLICTVTVLLLLLLLCDNNVEAFTVGRPLLTTNSRATVTPQIQHIDEVGRYYQQIHQQRISYLQTVSSTATDGNFEWEAIDNENDTDTKKDSENDEIDFMDQGVDNPYKKPDLIDPNTGTLKIDPARLLSPRMNGSNLYLIGMMGSGKSAIGKIIAKRMGTYTFLDTDEIVEKATNMSIPEIFQTEGEDAFREVETQVLDSVHTWVRCVISSGGGIVCRQENWSKLHTGLVVWLDVEPEIIYTRIKDTDRPLLQTDDPLQTLKDILSTRIDKYENADVRIHITKDMDENMVADTVIRELHNLIDINPPAWKLAKQKAQAEGLDWVK